MASMLDPSTFKQPLLLDIGAGGFSSDEKFTSVDLVTEADITATMWDIPLPDGSVTGIFSSNALEHVSKFDIIPTLKEWWRLLEVGGRLQLIVPDLEWAVSWWLQNKEDLGWSLDIIFGHQLHEGEYHKTGFTPAILEYYFKETGYNWYINKIEYMGGEVDFSRLDDAKYRGSITQRIISVEAAKT